MATNHEVGSSNLSGRAIFSKALGAFERRRSHVVAEVFVAGHFLRRRNQVAQLGPGVVRGDPPALVAKQVLTVLLIVDKAGLLLAFVFFTR